MAVVSEVTSRWRLMVVVGFVVVGLVGVFPRTAPAPTAVEYGIHSVGMTSTQTARLSVINDRAKAVTISGVILDDTDNVIKTFDLTVKGGQIGFIDLDGNSIGLDQGQRLQFRVVVTAPTNRLPVSLELFDSASGKTELVVIAFRPAEGFPIRTP